MKTAMNRLLALTLVGLLAACSSMSDNDVNIKQAPRSKEAAAQPKSAATIRIAGYSDARGVGDARKVGITTVRVIGMTGSDIRLDKDVVAVVADSMSSRLDEAGFLVLERDDPTALFELSGVVKTLSFDAKERDYISIKVETTLKEVATGKVVWAGEVAQKSDRFAGVSGNFKSDIADYLLHELDVVTGKTTESIKSVLLATRSNLFNLPAGAKAIEGVNVFTTQGATPSLNPNNTAVLKQLPVDERARPQLDGQVAVKTEPARAKVYLDGVYYGLSPISLNATAGVHTVEVKLTGYKKSSEKVAVRPDTTTEIEFQLEK
jgi:hypothetical protein